jgi:hypothetical protein
MTKSELKQFILEAVKKSVKKHEKKKSASAYITSPSDDNVTLHVNVSVQVKDLDDAENLKEEILKTLKTKHNITTIKYD